MAGVVRGENHPIGALRRDPPHDGPLAGVTFPAAAEQDEQAAGHQRPEHREHALERVRRVGIVAQHREWSVGEPLHSTGHLWRSRQPFHHVVERHAETEGDSRRTGCVGDVELAEERD